MSLNYSSSSNNVWGRPPSTTRRQQQPAISYSERVQGLDESSRRSEMPINYDNIPTLDGVVTLVGEAQKFHRTNSNTPPNRRLNQILSWDDNETTDAWKTMRIRGGGESSQSSGSSGGEATLTFNLSAKSKKEGMEWSSFTTTRKAETMKKGMNVNQVLLHMVREKTQSLEVEIGSDEDSLSTRAQGDLVRLDLSVVVAWSKGQVQLHRKPYLSSTLDQAMEICEQLMGTFRDLTQPMEGDDDDEAAQKTTSSGSNEEPVLSLFIAANWKEGSMEWSKDSRRKTNTVRKGIKVNQVLMKLIKEKTESSKVDASSDQGSSRKRKGKNVGINLSVTVAWSKGQVKLNRKPYLKATFDDAVQVCEEIVATFEDLTHPLEDDEEEESQKKQQRQGENRDVADMLADGRDPINQISTLRDLMDDLESQLTRTDAWELNLEGRLKAIQESLKDKDVAELEAEGAINRQLGDLQKSVGDLKSQLSQTSKLSTEVEDRLQTATEAASDHKSLTSGLGGASLQTGRDTASRPAVDFVPISADRQLEALKGKMNNLQQQLNQANRASERLETRLKNLNESLVDQQEQMEKAEAERTKQAAAKAEASKAEPSKADEFTSAFSALSGPKKSKETKEKSLDDFSVDSSIDDVSSALESEVDSRRSPLKESNLPPRDPDGQASPAVPTRRKILDEPIQGAEETKDGRQPPSFDSGGESNARAQAEGLALPPLSGDAWPSDATVSSASDLPSLATSVSCDSFDRLLGPVDVDNERSQRNRAAHKEATDEPIDHPAAVAGEPQTEAEEEDVRVDSFMKAYSAVSSPKKGIAPQDQDGQSIDASIMSISSATYRSETSEPPLFKKSERGRSPEPPSPQAAQKESKEALEPSTAASGAVERGALSREEPDDAKATESKDVQEDANAQAVDQFTQAFSALSTPKERQAPVADEGVIDDVDSSVQTISTAVYEPDVEDEKRTPLDIKQDRVDETLPFKKLESSAEEHDTRGKEIAAPESREVSSKEASPQGQSEEAMSQAEAGKVDDFTKAFSALSGPTAPKKVSDDIDESIDSSIATIPSASTQGEQVPPGESPQVESSLRQGGAGAARDQDLAVTATPAPATQAQPEPVDPKSTEVSTRDAHPDGQEEEATSQAEAGKVDDFTKAFSALSSPTAAKKVIDDDDESIDSSVDTIPSGSTSTRSKGATKAATERDPAVAAAPAANTQAHPEPAAHKSTEISTKDAHPQGQEDEAMGQDEAGKVDDFTKAFSALSSPTAPKKAIDDNDESIDSSVDTIPSGSTQDEQVPPGESKPVTGPTQVESTRSQGATEVAKDRDPTVTSIPATTTQTAPEPTELKSEPPEVKSEPANKVDDFTTAFSALNTPQQKQKQDDASESIDTSIDTIPSASTVAESILDKPKQPVEQSKPGESEGIVDKSKQLPDQSESTVDISEARKPENPVDKKQASEVPPKPQKSSVDDFTQAFSAVQAPPPKAKSQVERFHDSIDSSLGTISSVQTEGDESQKSAPDVRQADDMDASRKVDDFTQAFSAISKGAESQPLQEDDDLAGIDSTVGSVDSVEEPQTVPKGSGVEDVSTPRKVDEFTQAFSALKRDSTVKKPSQEDDDDIDSSVSYVDSADDSTAESQDDASGKQVQDAATPQKVDDFTQAFSAISKDAESKPVKEDEEDGIDSSVPSHIDSSVDSVDSAKEVADVPRQDPINHQDVDTATHQKADEFTEAFSAITRDAADTKPPQEDDEDAIDFFVGSESEVSSKAAPPKQASRAGDIPHLTSEQKPHEEAILTLSLSANWKRAGKEWSNECRRKAGSVRNGMQINQILMNLAKEKTQNTEVDVSSYEPAMKDNIVGLNHSLTVAWPKGQIKLQRKPYLDTDFEDAVEACKALLDTFKSLTNPLEDEESQEQLAAAAPQVHPRESTPGDETSSVGLSLEEQTKEPASETPPPETKPGDDTSVAISVESMGSTSVEEEQKTEPGEAHEEKGPSKVDDIIDSSVGSIGSASVSVMNQDMDDAKTAVKDASALPAQEDAEATKISDRGALALEDHKPEQDGQERVDEFTKAFAAVTGPEEKDKPHDAATGVDVDSSYASAESLPSKAEPAPAAASKILEESTPASKVDEFTNVFSALNTAPKGAPTPADDVDGSIDSSVGPIASVSYVSEEEDLPAAAPEKPLEKKAKPETSRSVPRIVEKAGEDLTDYLAGSSGSGGRIADGAALEPAMAKEEEMFNAPHATLGDKMDALERRLGLERDFLVQAEQLVDSLQESEDMLDDDSTAMKGGNKWLQGKQESPEGEDPSVTISVEELSDAGSSSGPSSSETETTEDQMLAGPGVPRQDEPIEEAPILEAPPKRRDPPKQWPPVVTEKPTVPPEPIEIEEPEPEASEEKYVEPPPKKWPTVATGVPISNSTKGARKPRLKEAKPSIAEGTTSKLAQRFAPAQEKLQIEEPVNQTFALDEMSEISFSMNVDSTLPSEPKEPPPPAASPPPTQPAPPEMAPVEEPIVSMEPTELLAEKDAPLRDESATPIAPKNPNAPSETTKAVGAVESATNLDILQSRQSPRLISEFPRPADSNVRVNLDDDSSSAELSLETLSTSSSEARERDMRALKDKEEQEAAARKAAEDEAAKQKAEAERLKEEARIAEETALAKKDAEEEEEEAARQKLEEERLKQEEARIEEEMSAAEAEASQKAAVEEAVRQKFEEESLEQEESRIAEEMSAAEAEASQKAAVEEALKQQIEEESLKKEEARIAEEMAAAEAAAVKKAAEEEATAAEKEENEEGSSSSSEASSGVLESSESEGVKQEVIASPAESEGEEEAEDKEKTLVKNLLENTPETPGSVEPIGPLMEFDPNNPLDVSGLDEKNVEPEEKFSEEALADQSPKPEVETKPDAEEESPMPEDGPPSWIVSKSGPSRGIDAPRNFLFEFTKEPDPAGFKPGKGDYDKRVETRHGDDISIVSVNSELTASTGDFDLEDELEPAAAKPTEKAVPAVPTAEAAPPSAEEAPSDEAGRRREDAAESSKSETPGDTGNDVELATPRSFEEEKVNEPLRPREVRNERDSSTATSHPFDEISGLQDRLDPHGVEFMKIDRRDIEFPDSGGVQQRQAPSPPRAVPRGVESRGRPRDAHQVSSRQEKIPLHPGRPQGKLSNVDDAFDRLHRLKNRLRSLRVLMDTTESQSQAAGLSPNQDHLRPDDVSGALDDFSRELQRARQTAANNQQGPSPIDEAYGSLLRAQSKLRSLKALARARQAPAM